MAHGECDLLCLDLARAESVRAVLPPSDSMRPASDRARALADPTRLRVALAIAAAGELCVCDLAWVCGLAQNLVSHHVRQLRGAGLADSRRDGRLVMYRLTDGGLTLLAAVTDDAAMAAPTPRQYAPAATAIATAGGSRHAHRVPKVH